MNRAVRHATLAVADAATEGLDMATVVIGGAIGAWAGYTYYPETWSGDWRLALTGAIAVIAAVAVNSMAGLILAPLRRLLNKTRAQLVRTATRTAPAVPATLGEGLTQVVTATKADAASRASSAAWRIDKGDDFLHDETRWSGYENGEASFFLAPGVQLHFRSEKDQYGTGEARFTLLTGDGDQPVPITNVEQIRHQLAARAAGLPAAPAGSEDRDEETGLLAELDDQLKALGA
ncbi:hypothetical protein [Streptomyces atratus]|uniref:hypothetical protein n=1 Tax=Streptomyces atratus TaxID=1893 RepID=UPI0021A35A68|nr:hypothetical protein [Streptomyces atratus]MCT2546260.1 hypothetical protein [Streptomyces atratus]